jgi:hypothetical protein
LWSDECAGLQLDRTYLGLSAIERLSLFGSTKLAASSVARFRRRELYAIISSDEGLERVWRRLAG